MFKKILVLVLLIHISSSALFSQIKTAYVTRGAEAFSMQYFEAEKRTTQQWLNPYLDENWKPGHIIFSDSILWEGELRYDLFRKEMEMVIKADTFIISDPFMVNQIVMDNKAFKYCVFVEDRQKMKSFGSDYFEVLTNNNKANLLLRRQLRVDDSKSAPGNLQLGIRVVEKKWFCLKIL
ncbi:MAG: hypothetical protein CVT92_17165 [Bacteroidetes bacterium HGW-Bacteroidetes-1]|jgi:hypothetical protein|nr:MAG: hypothetical protein CVT92_17165 [Bacteroidetes bacterium HGW-Bacteroidetes-1]